MNSEKVAVQLISSGGVYGAERVLLELASYLRDKGWRSHVVALEGEGARELVTLAAAQGLDAEAFVVAGRMAFLPMVMRLERLLRQYPRAIVHSHNYKPDMLLSLLRIPRRLGCLATCHSSYRETRKLQFLAALDKRAIRRFDCAVAVSAEIYRELIDSGIPQEKVALIHNGIRALRVIDDSPKDPVRAEFQIPADAKLVVQIGRLVRSKRNDLLLEAVSRLPPHLDTHLLLVGEGDQRQALAAQARSQGLEQRVHFSGYRNDIAQILATGDVLALTSDYEGLPVVIMEAMAMRCPIVATRVGAIPDVLTDGHDAWIVPINDIGALVDAVAEALGNPHAAHFRTENAHSKFVAQHSRDAMGARYLEIYESVWARRGWT
jgi:glycosyltransferase involved in cell wall biosynthesis